MALRARELSNEAGVSESGSSVPPIEATAQACITRWRSHWPWILGAASGLLYLWSFSAGSDGIIVGNDVVNYADDLIGGSEHPLQGSPHHLGYRWLCLAVYRALALWPGCVKGSGLALLAQQIVAALGGALTVVAIARLSNRQAGWRIALPLSSALALTGGLWFSCAVGDSYLPAMSASAWLLCTALGPATGGKRPRAVQLFIWLLASVLLRQDAVLILPALAVLVPWRTLVPVVALAGLSALCLYALAWTNDGADTSFSTWLLGLATTGLWGHGWSAEGLQVASRFFLCTLQPAHSEHPAAGWLTLTLLLLALILAWPWPAPARRGVVACGIYGLSCFGFFTWWQAANHEYQIPMLLPFFAALAVLIRPRGPGWRIGAQVGLLWAGAAALGIGTWAREIRPYRGCEISAHSRLALEAAGPDGVVCALDAWQMLALVRERRARLGQRVNATRLVEVYGAAPRKNREATLQLRQVLLDTLAAGQRAVLIAEQVLPAHLVGPRRANPDILKRVLGEVPHVALLDEHGRELGQVVGTEVR